MSTTGSTAAQFHSLAALRAEHAGLLKRKRETSDANEFLDEVESLITRGRVLGCVLEDEEDRTEAQGLINYWVTFLYRTNRTPPDDTCLLDFDISSVPELPDESCPYVGLELFGEGESQVFFGRQRLEKHFLDYLKRHTLLVIVGPPGSGKSSLVRAGLLPVLRAGEQIAGSGDWVYHIPESPSAEMRFSAGNLTVELGGKPTLHLIEHFGDLFFENDKILGERLSLIEKLVRHESGNHRVIVTARPEPLRQVKGHESFQELFERSTFQLAPPRASELREAIEGPAGLVGLKFDSGVVDKLLNDIAGEPNPLPLLQFTLLRLWEERERNRITWSAYQRVGSAREALARNAGQLYDSLTEPEKAATKKILKRLAHISGRLAIRTSRVNVQQLKECGDAATVERVLAKFTEARLLRRVNPSEPLHEEVELVHETLAYNWDKLIEWLEEEREVQRRRWQLTVAAEEWERLDRNPAALWRGVFLEEARHFKDLNPLETAFRAASIKAEEERHRRELAVERLRTIRAKRNARILAAFLAIAVILVGVALYQWSKASREERIASSRELAFAAIHEKTADPERSILLALESVEALRRNGEEPTMEAHDALRQALHAPPVPLATLDGHTNLVFRGAFSPDGAKLATASFDGTIRLYEASDEGWRFVQALTASSAQVWDVSFSPDGGYLASAHADGDLAIWRVARGDRVPNAVPGVAPQDAKSKEPVISFYSVGFSPDGNFLFSGDQSGQITRWKVESTPKDIRITQASPWKAHNGGVWKLAFSKDSRYLASASLDRTAKVWRVQSGGLLTEVKGHRDRVYGVAFHPEREMLASASVDGTVRIIDLNDGSLITELTPHQAPVMDVEFSLDGQYLGTASLDGTAKILDPESGLEYEVLTAHTDGVTSIGFHPNRRELVTTSVDQTAKTWRLLPAEQLRKYRGHTFPIYGLAFSPVDRGVLASAGYDQNAILWRASGPATILRRDGERNTHAERVHGVAFSPDGKVLATASQDKTVRFWDTASGAFQRELSHGASVTGVAFSPDGKRLVTAGWDNLCKIWDLESDSAEPASVCEAKHEDWLYGAAYSPDGSLIATASRDKTARIWDSQTGKELAACEGHTGGLYAVAFSADSGRLITTSLDKTARVWEIDRQPWRCRPIASLAHDSAVWSVAYHAAPELVATASHDRTARLWRPSGRREPDGMEIWEEVSRMTHDAPMRAVAFNLAGTEFATAGLDNTVYLNPVTIEGLMGAANCRVTRELTEIECGKYLHGPCPAWPRRVCAVTPVAASTGGRAYPVP